MLIALLFCCYFLSFDVLFLKKGSSIVFDVNLSPVALEMHSNCLLDQL